MRWLLGDDQGQAAFDRARRVGFLVAGESSPWHRRFEAWCRQNRRPLVWVWQRGPKADIVLRVDTCGGTLDPEQVDRLDFLLSQTTPHLITVVSLSRCLIRNVPAGQAELVAFRVFELAMEGIRQAEPASTPGPLAAPGA